YTAGNISIITTAPPPVPSPEPSPVPVPQPVPTPQPSQVPVPQPVPTPQPSPMPVPQPVPSPMPVPQPVPSPMPVPQPVPTPQPSPMPIPQPVPTPPPSESVTVVQRSIDSLPSRSQEIPRQTIADPPPSGTLETPQRSIDSLPSDSQETPQRSIDSPPSRPLETSQKTETAKVPPATTDSSDSGRSSNTREVEGPNPNTTPTDATETNRPKNGTVQPQPILVIEDSITNRNRPAAENTNSSQTLTVENSSDRPRSNNLSRDNSTSDPQVLSLETAKSSNIFAAPKPSSLRLFTATTSTSESGNHPLASIDSNNSPNTSIIRISNDLDSASITLARASATQSLDAGNIDNAVGDIELLAENLYTKYFGYDVSQASPKSVQSIRQTLATIESQTGNRSAIIYAIARPDQLDLILVTAAGETVYRNVREASRHKLFAAAANLRMEITNPRKRKTTSYLASAKQLYQWLIQPLETELKNQKIDTLLFNLDGALKTVPLAALHDGKQFLVENYSISTIPSITLTDTRYQSLADARVLAMGASVFVEQEPLPGVSTELQNITAEWPGKFFLNENFTFNNLKSQRASITPQIIHLATHGEFRSGPNNSYIQLWDSKLLMNQIRQLGLNDPPVELLVLSACRTAVGDEQAELGFAGFAVQAGVKSVLASLWYVSDEGSLALMTDFYSQLRNVNIKAEALRKTQIDMIRGRMNLESTQMREQNFGENTLASPIAGNAESNNLSHPYYWAGFTMIGSPW
ncbi:MAG: CHAT domain-containing protein, partial [Microcoleus sp.]